MLLVCQPELTWQQIVAFVGPLRAPYLPSFTPIVVLLDTFPPKHMWDQFPDVAFLVTSPVILIILTGRFVSFVWWHENRWVLLRPE